MCRQPPSFSILYRAASESEAMGIRDQLRRLLRDAPADAEAIEYEGECWSWGRVQRTAGALTELLDQAELGAHARIGLVLENRPEHVAALAAVIASERCVVTFSPLQPAARLASDIIGSHAPVVVAGAQVLAGDEVMAAVTGQRLAIELDTGGAVRRGGGSAPFDARARPGVAVEMLTSGTTGPPKRIPLGIRQLDQGLAAGGHAPRTDRLLAGSASMVSVPLVHIGGLWGLLAGLAGGRCIILLPRFALEPWVSAVERHRLRAAGLVPPAIRSLVDADVDPKRLSSLQVVVSGTAACPADLAEAFLQKYGVPVLSTYGATEFAGAVAGWTLPLYKRWCHSKAGSAGRAFPGVELQVTGPDGVALPAGHTGVLEVRTAQTAQGAGAWVPTSDLARLDADGFLWICGRADDVIIRGGFKVAPETVKAILESHPAVREAAVAGLPDRRLGAVPVAAVAAAPRLAPPLAADLIAYCRKHLTPYEVPAHILVVDELPRGPSSKVSRVDLIDLIRAQLAQDIPC